MERMGLLKRVLPPKPKDPTRDGPPIVTKEHIAGMAKQVAALRVNPKLLAKKKPE